jgi:hypothetical protein
MTAEAILILVGVGYVCFRQWLRHDKRRMIHLERLAAIEKGREMPAVELESSRNEWGIQRYLLVAGWSWIAIGVGGGLSLYVMLRNASPEWLRELPPLGSEVAAIVPIGIGLAHLATYRVGERREKRGERAD